MEQKITAAMIAEKAGVSPATMSRYLREGGRVRPASAEKIEKAMKELGVTKDTPKEIAPPRREPVIVVNIPGIVNTFYNEILRGIQTSARMHGYSVLIHESLLGGGALDTFCGLLESIGASGVILMVSLNEAALARIRAIVPLVQCSEHNENTDYPYVSINDRAAARMATAHLIACGCNKVALINSSLSCRYARHRQEGFLDAMREAENFVPQNWIVQLPEVNYALAYSAVCRLLNEDTRPNAFFAVSDIYAVAVLRAASRFRLRIPQDLMVVGFDNLDLTAMTCPSITTVSQSSYQQGYSACELLADMIEQPELIPKPILVDTELILRESTFPGMTGSIAASSP